MGGPDILETVTGSVENVVYHSELNDYTVLELAVDDTLVTAVGEINAVAEGEVLTLTGSWTYHREFGRQFAFVSYEKSLPSEIEGIIQYLSSRAVKGVGPVTAVKIVNKFGLDTFDVMENHPEWLADIPGITMKKAAAICESFREQSELRNVMMFFKDYIGAGEVTRIYKKLGASSIGVVRSNPYILCGYEYSLPFEKVDRIAASLGFSPTADERIFSGLEYVLSYNAQMNGHTCLPKEKLIAAAAELLAIDGEHISSSLDAFLDSERLVEYRVGEDIYVMTVSVAEDEDYIARRLASLSREVIGFSRGDIAAMIASGIIEELVLHTKQAFRLSDPCPYCDICVLGYSKSNSYGSCRDSEQDL